MWENRNKDIFVKNINAIFITPLCAFSGIKIVIYITLSILPHITLSYVTQKSWLFVTDLMTAAE